MKKISVLMMAIVLVVFGACAMSCGGSSGSSTPSAAAEQAAENSLDAFVTLITSAAVLPCMTGEAENCDCPGGGSITTTATTLTMDNCIAASGDTYDGSISSEDGETFDGNMSQFGECTNMTASSVVSDACSGTITGTCASETYTCTLTDGSNDDCDCS